MKLSFKQSALVAASMGTLLLASSSVFAAPAVTQTAPNIHPSSKEMPMQAGEQGKHGRMGMGRGGDMQRLSADLNLTAAQQTQVSQLRNQYQAKFQQLRATAMQYDQNIATQTQTQANASTATLLNLYKQRQATMEQALALHQQEQQQFMNILTPEQQLKLYQGRTQRMQQARQAMPRNK